MKEIPTKQAVGHVLCHDITQIIPGVTKDALFRKGHIVREEDIPLLLSVGKTSLFIWEQDDTKYHEDEAAEILREICQGEGMVASPPKEGKIELSAQEDGFLQVNLEGLRAVNALGEMMIATVPSGYPVKKGGKLCGTRVIPLTIEKEKMERARQVAGGQPLLQLRPLLKKSFGVVTTGSEVYNGLITDKFTPVLVDKLGEYGCKMTNQILCDDNQATITQAIETLAQQGAEMIFCTGGMSVDPDDRTPLAIRKAGAEVVSYGAPVLPGAMFLVSYLPDGRPVCGLPGCVMYAKRTIFDILLPYLLAEVEITGEILAGLGHGGLCLSCEPCHFPNCGFGKGV